MAGKQVDILIYLIVIGGYAIGAVGLVEFICYVHPGISEFSYSEVPLFHAILIILLLSAASITSARRIISYREKPRIL